MTHQQAEINLWIDKLVVTFKCQLEGYSQSLQTQRKDRNGTGEHLMI